MSSSTVFVACFTGCMFAMVFAFVFGLQIVWWLVKRYFKKHSAEILTKFSHQLLHGTPPDPVMAREWSEIMQNAEKTPPGVIPHLELATCKHCGIQTRVPLDKDFDEFLDSLGWKHMIEGDPVELSEIGWWCEGCATELRQKSRHSSR